MTKEATKTDDFNELAATLTAFAAQCHGLSKRIKDETDGRIMVNMKTLRALINEKLDDRMRRIAAEVDTAIAEVKHGKHLATGKKLPKK